MNKAFIILFLVAKVNTNSESSRPLFVIIQWDSVNSVFNDAFQSNIG